MKRLVNLRCLFVSVVCLSATAAMACSWAEGYFFQVTSLHGSLVGVSDGDFRHRIKWMRQHVVQESVSMTLYEYRWPASIDELKRIRQIKTDANGQFDFGHLNKGHYKLVIDTPWHSQDYYGVEIVQSKTKTTSVMIDISSNFPDCTGGHEFIARVE